MKRRPRKERHEYEAERLAEAYERHKRARAEQRQDEEA